MSSFDKFSDYVCKDIIYTLVLWSKSDTNTMETIINRDWIISVRVCQVTSGGGMVMSVILQSVNDIKDFPSLTV